MRYDIAIVGAGIAGATLAAAIGDAANVVLIEGESHPGYHATGRSAAFWSETYGGPAVQPLTSASGPLLDRAGVLGPRGEIHIANDQGARQLAALAEAFAGSGVVLDPVDRAGLVEIVPGLRTGWDHGLFEPTCRDIDVAALHAMALHRSRTAGTVLRCDSQVLSIHSEHGGWRIVTRSGEVTAGILVNAAGAWAGELAKMAGALPIAITPMRRTIVQLVTDPAPPADLPLVIDAAGGFYFKAEAGGRLWLSPHDETPVPAHDVAPEEIDVAVAIDRLERVVDWRVVRRERAWAGLRSFAPDRAPVYGFDPQVPGFFWCAGQGGFGIQTAPAAAEMAAALLLGVSLPEVVGDLDPERYSPRRFDRAA